MADIASINQIELEAQDVDNKIRKVQPAEQKQKKAHGKGAFNALLLAYYCIFEAVITSHQTAAVQAKQLQSNASAQNALINREQGVNFVTMSHDKVWETLKQYRIHVTLSAWVSGKVKHWRETITHWGPLDRRNISTQLGGHVIGEHKTVLQSKRIDKKIGADSLAGLNMKNEESSAVRSVIQDKLSLLGQGAQIAESYENSTVSEAQMSMQEGSGVMQMLMSLTQQIAQI